MSATRKNRHIPRIVLLSLIILVLIVSIILFYVMQRSNPQGVTGTTPSPEDPMTDIPFRKQGELFFISQQNRDTLAMIDIEVADNDQLRARGLMYRRTLPENGGMLFIQDMEEIQSFWMKNTYIPLDILFVNTAKKIVTIQANTTPLKEWNYASTEPALYVVEVNAGFTTRHGIRSGDGIEFVIAK